MKFLFCVIGCLGWMSGAVSAAVLLQYEFTAGSLAPSLVDADYVAGNITRSGLVSPASFATDWAYAQGDQTPASLNAGYYFAITLTPDSGITYNLTSLDFGTSFYNASGSNSGYNTNYVVRSSLDGYTANLTSIVQAGQVSTSPTFTPQTVDLTGMAFQNLSTAITFRIYIWDSISGASRRSAFDDLTLNGATIPEPSVVGLMAAGVFLWVLRLRGQSRRRVGI